MIYKNQILLFSILSFLLISCQPTESPQTEKESDIRVMTYNIRFDIPDDDDDNWDQRKEQLSSLIQFNNPAVLGIQEGLLHQLEYLEKELDTYKWIGAGRDDGATEGEFSAILYDTTKVTLVPDTDKTIWLSETPNEPSEGWDAALPRVLTYGKFELLNTGQTFWAFNTHFDHVGETSRHESAKLIQEEAGQVDKKAPVIVMGDFNFTPDSDPYETLTTGGNKLYDSYNISGLSPLGPQFTFEGFEVGSEEDGRRIDYVFVNDRIQVLKHATISSFRDGYYPSDHLPVAIDLEFE
ncbi:MAG: endonuclease/exonuclease/phosphatase family protein [Bacteroidota bacterium]